MATSDADASAAASALADGTRMLQAGDLAAAVRAYARAASLDPRSPRAPSNSAIARLRMGDAASLEAAVRDADEAIARDANWAKAYSTKGAALEGLGRRAEARDAYQAGLRVDAASETLRENLARLERAASAGAGAPSPGAAAAGAQQRRSASAGAAGANAGAGAGAGAAPAGDWYPVPPPLVAEAQAPATVAQKTLQAARVLLLLLAVAYLLPLRNGIPVLAFNSLMALSAAVHAAVLLMRYPVPALSLAGGVRGLGDAATQWAFGERNGFMKDASLPPIFLPLVFLAASRTRPCVAAPFAIALVDFWYALEFVAGVMPSEVGRRMLKGLGTSIALRLGLGAGAASPEELARLPAAERRRRVLRRLLELSAMAELACALIALFELALPFRNVALAMVQWQTFVVRYPLSPYIRTAFARLHGAIEGALAHALVPAVVRSAYGALAGFVASYVPDPRTGAYGGDNEHGRRGGIAGLVNATRNACTIV